jgi:NCS1 family nucleobase:cation symporter-1
VSEAQRRPGLAAIGSEYRALDKIPEYARSFSTWDQAALWFGAASLPAAWLYGAIMAGWTGLGGALLFILIVSPLAFLPWAALGHIAARVGGASVAIVRPAFGLRGSALPAIFYLVFGFGWAAVNVFVGSIGTSFIFKGMFGTPALGEPGFQGPMAVSILVTCAVQGFFAVAGHRAIRAMEWVAVTGLVLLGAYETYLALSTWGTSDLFAWRPAAGLSTSIGPFSYIITFALLLDLLVAYNWTWEFIGDFSRFARTPRAGGAGPWIGANIAQTWWFFVGALGVVFLAIQTGQFNPALSDPSSVATQLGFGAGAYLVILLATVATNAGNIYASALGISQFAPRSTMPMRGLLLLSAVVVVPLSLLPLVAADLLGSYIFFLDFVGALVVPLWTIVLVDYFVVRRREYSDDLFRTAGGIYWYEGGVHWPGVASLALGTAVYWVIGFAFPDLRSAISATIPTILVVAIAYAVTARRDARAAQPSAAAATLPPA